MSAERECTARARKQTGFTVFNRPVKASDLFLLRSKKVLTFSELYLIFTHDPAHHFTNGPNGS